MKNFSPLFFGLNRKTTISSAIIVVIIAGAVFFSRTDGTIRKSSDLSSDTTGLVISDNAIYVADQIPSSTLTIAIARLARPGFIVIHEDNAGETGKILGQSDWLTAGEIKNPKPIRLSRLTKDGETLYAMLHLDDGDGIFDVKKDMSVLDQSSNLPMMMIVTVSTEATDSGVVRL